MALAPHDHPHPLSTEHANETPTATQNPTRDSHHAKALLVSFDEAAGGAASHVDALTREVQLTFKRLDGDIRALSSRPGPGAREEDAGVRLQVQRQLAQALFKLSVEFRWARWRARLAVRGLCVSACAWRFVVGALFL
jgi:hypothetical protein